MFGSFFSWVLGYGESDEEREQIKRDIIQNLKKIQRKVELLQGEEKSQYVLLCNRISSHPTMDSACRQLDVRQICTKVANAQLELDVLEKVTQAQTDLLNHWDLFLTVDELQGEMLANISSIVFANVRFSDIQIMPASFLTHLKRRFGEDGIDNMIYDTAELLPPTFHKLDNKKHREPSFIEEYIKAIYELRKNRPDQTGDHQPKPKPPKLPEVPVATKSTPKAAPVDDDGFILHMAARMEALREDNKK